MIASLVIPNRNDTVMLAVTVRSALEELKAIEGDTEIVIVDNSDTDIWNLLKTPNLSPLSLSYVQSGKVKLIRQPFPSLYSARQTGMENASGKYIIQTDSHVMYGRDALRDIVNFMERAQDNVGLGFSPVGWISQPESFARHDIRPSKEGCIFGPWGRRYEAPTKICWQFGFRIANRQWVLEGLNGYGFLAREQVSWGGGEFFIAIKNWLMGKENWAIPAAPVYHIGPFNKHLTKISGHRYRMYDGSGKGKVGIGILGSFYALGGGYAKSYLEEKEGNVLKQYNIDLQRDWPEAKRLAAEDRKWVEANQVLSFEQFVEEEPWMEGWGADRWEQWKPQRELKQIVKLSSLG